MSEQAPDLPRDEPFVASWITASPGARIRFPHSARPELSIVSVTYGTGPVVLRSLAALATSLRADDVDAEMVVVDHAHPARGRSTQRLLRLGTSGVRVVAVDRNLGFGGGNELGIAHARAGVLCLMNPDVSMSSGSIRALMSAARSNPDAVISPTLSNPDGSVQERGQQLIDDGATRPVLDAPVDSQEGLIELREDHYASAACWFLTRSLHERVGGFDPAYHPAYYEDADYAMRVRRVGGRMLVADVDVTHVRGGSTDDAPADTRRQRDVFLARWAQPLGWGLTRPRS